MGIIKKLFKRYRIEYYRKRIQQNPKYFIDQLNEYGTKKYLKKDVKQVYFYPTVILCKDEIKLNKLLLIVSADNFFLCNGETITNNTKVIEYQLKLKDINDYFYKECFSLNDENEIRANEVYSEISELLSKTKAANNKHFKISPFFNYWHSSLLNDHWQYIDCQLDTDDFIVIKYKLQKKKYKNYCFNPCLLYGATKEKALQLGLDSDENSYYAWLNIPLEITTLSKTLITLS